MVVAMIAQNPELGAWEPGALELLGALTLDPVGRSL